LKLKPKLMSKYDKLVNNIHTRNKYNNNDNYNYTTKKCLEVLVIMTQLVRKHIRGIIRMAWQIFVYLFRVKYKLLKANTQQ